MSWGSGDVRSGIEVIGVWASKDVGISGRGFNGLQVGAVIVVWWKLLFPSASSPIRCWFLLSHSVTCSGIVLSRPL